jgi:threonine dehydrogenase-like Zn-dependent dehydrogenase
VLAVDLLTERCKRAATNGRGEYALRALTAAGRLRPEAVVSHRLPLSHGQEAYRLLAAREGVSKIVLDPRR